MSKTIKIIDLLNKIANGEDVPKKIQYEDREYYFNVNIREYIYFDEEACINRYFIDLLRCTDLNDNVEIIEEQEGIDIQKIEELEIYSEIVSYDYRDIEINRKLINKLVQAVKQLDKNIKEKQ